MYEVKCFPHGFKRSTWIATEHSFPSACEDDSSYKLLVIL